MERFWAIERDGGTLVSRTMGDGLTFSPFRFEECHRPGRQHETWRWSTADVPGGWEADNEQLRAALLASVDYLRDRHLATVAATVSPERRREYDAKARELGRADGPWPMIEAEAAARGVSLDQVRVGVAAAIAAEDAAIAPIAAAAVAAKAALRAAGSAEQLQNVFDTIPWPSAEQQP